MAKSSSASASAPRSAASKRVLGVTRDGVRILDPGPGTHFTVKQIRDAIASVREAERKAG